MGSGAERQHALKYPVPFLCHILRRIRYSMLFLHELLGPRKVLRAAVCCTAGLVSGRISSGVGVS